MGENAIYNLGDDQRAVEERTNCERGSEAGRRMMVTVGMVVMVLAIVKRHVSSVLFEEVAFFVSLTFAPSKARDQ